MGLSAEQRKQLKELQRLEQEPDSPPANVNFSLDLSSDAAWDRARKLGLIPGDDSSDGDGEDDDDDDDHGGDEIPRRRSSLQNRIMGVED